MSIVTQDGRRLERALGDRITFSWTGSPQQGLMLRPSDALAIPFSLMWGGFAIFWETLVVRGHAPLFMQLWGIPFVCVGSFMIFGRFFLDSYSRAHTSYGVGPDAVYIVRDGLQPRTLTVMANNLSPIEIQRRPDGSGTLRFGPQTAPSYGVRLWNIGLPAAFEGIRGVDGVYQLVEAMASRR